ncbi:MAG: Gfo/Idh/MocA family oxidoreductase [Oscillospiraceae bacterium]
MKFGIIGTNFVTDYLMEAGIDSREFEVGAVYSRTIERAREFAQKYSPEYGEPILFDSLDELAACPEIDAVYIASPNALHCEQAIKMLNAGKHVLCEKPLASNLREAKQMLQCAKKNNRVLLEAMRIAFTPQLEELKNQIKQIGKLRMAQLSFCQYSSRYERFLKGERINTFDPSLSNAALLDLGVYCINMMIALFGRPLGVTASDIKLDGGFDALGALCAEYDGMLCSIKYSKVSADGIQNEIQGESGSVVFDRITMTNKITRTDRETGEKCEIKVDSLAHDMTYEIDAFIEMIKGMRSAEYHNECSVMAMEIMDEARRQCKIVFPADTGMG